jgi:ubiquinone biosynthesis protein COQ4
MFVSNAEEASMNTNAASYDPRRAFIALKKLFHDPDDLPQVFTVVEAMSGHNGDRMLARLRSSEGGARLVDTRADIVPLLRDREALRRYPERSLARAYLAFLESENISAEGIIDASDKGRSGDAPAGEVQWLHDRLRDTHDLWHAVTGYKGDVLGESALLGFIFAQTRNLGVALVFALGLLKIGRDSAARDLMIDGFRRGRRAAWLPAVEWETLLALPVDQVRALLGVGAPPSYVPVRSAALRARAAA